MKDKSFSITDKETIAEYKLEVDFMRKNLNATAEEYDAALGKIARLQVDLHQTVVELEETKELLQKFAYFDEFSKTWTAKPEGKPTAINHVSVGA